MWASRHHPNTKHTKTSAPTIRSSRHLKKIRTADLHETVCQWTLKWVRDPSWPTAITKGKLTNKCSSDCRIIFSTPTISILPNSSVCAYFVSSDFEKGRKFTVKAAALSKLCVRHKPAENQIHSVEGNRNHTVEVIKTTGDHHNGDNVRRSSDSSSAQNPNHVHDSMALTSPYSNGPEYKHFFRSLIFEELRSCFEAALEKSAAFSHKTSVCYNSFMFHEHSKELIILSVVPPPSVNTKHGLGQFGFNDVVLLHPGPCSCKTVVDIL